MNSTILLVEDDENDVFFMKRAMKQGGMVLPDVATDGQAAIDYLQQRIQTDPKQLPGLVLLDLKLPRVMGLEVLQWIRQQPALDTMAVIVLTSSSLHSDIDRARELGATSYLVKAGTSEGGRVTVELIKTRWAEWQKGIRRN